MSLYLTSIKIRQIAMAGLWTYSFSNWVIVLLRKRCFENFSIELRTPTSASSQFGEIHSDLPKLILLSQRKFISWKGRQQASISALALNFTNLIYLTAAADTAGSHSAEF